MRPIYFIALFCLSLGARAAEPPPPAEAPPPPHMQADDDAGPGVTITKQGGRMVEEYRANGKLYMIKITPKHGAPYYLVDDLGDGKFVRQESLDSGFRVPRWVIKRF
jgi:hypothetical protein